MHYSNPFSDARFCCDKRRRYASQLGMAALTAALNDRGRGEIGRNNAGKYVWSLTGRKTSGAWCAAAVYSWILRASVWLEVPCPVPRIHGARKLCRAIRDCNGGHETSDPLPGDIVLWSRGAGRWQGHVGIVESVQGLKFRSVEGNRGDFPAYVDVFTHDARERRLLGFHRLP